MKVKPTFNLILRESVLAEKNIIRMLAAHPRKEQSAVLRSRMTLGFMILEQELERHAALDDYQRILACVKTGLARKTGCAEGIMTYLRARTLYQEKYEQHPLSMLASMTASSAASPTPASVTPMTSPAPPMQPPLTEPQAGTPSRPTAHDGSTAPAMTSEHPEEKASHEQLSEDRAEDAPFDWASSPFAALAGR